MKQVSGQAFCTILRRNGWECARIKGSHHIYNKPGVIAILTVPVHANKPLNPGLLRHLLKQANLTEDDL